jgi:predicted transcriptional regulator
MSASTTMTIRLGTDVKEKLDRIASATNRSRSYLAAEAVASYVDRELEIIEGIRRGLADIDAGRLVAHDDAMDEIDAIIDAVEAEKSDRA